MAGGRVPRCTNSETTLSPSEYSRSATSPPAILVEAAAYSGRPPGRVTGSSQPWPARDVGNGAGAAAATQAGWAGCDCGWPALANRGTANAPNWTRTNESSLITFSDVS